MRRSSAKGELKPFSGGRTEELRTGEKALAGLLADGCVLWRKDQRAVPKHDCILNSFRYLHSGLASNQASSGVCRRTRELAQVVHVRR
jgi:hypothetical protein